MAARNDAQFTDVDDLSRRTALTRRDLEALAVGNVFASIAGHRREAWWAETAQHTVPKLLRDAPIAEPPLALPQAAESREIVDDYASLGRTLNRHPLALLRSRVPQQRFRTAAELAACRHGTLARACGASPPCGSGWARRAAPCSFLSKTKTGSINVIVWPSLVQKQREALLGLSSLGVYGVLQRDGGVATDGDLADSVGIQIGRPRGNGKTEAK